MIPILRNPKLVLKPAFSVVGLLQHLERQDGASDSLWEQLGARFKEIPNADPDSGYGVHSWSESGHCYLAGLAVGGEAKGITVPEGMATRHFGKQVYAVFTHMGLTSALLNTVDAIFTDGLSCYGYQPVDGFFFEYYDDHFQLGSADSVIFIYVPVHPPGG